MLTRRAFLTAAGTAAFAAGCSEEPPGEVHSARPSGGDGPPETLVRLLHDSLSPAQKRVVCFPWNHVDPQRGLLRTFVCNSWRITPPAIRSDFYTLAQQALIRDIFVGLVNPEWVHRFDRQFEDDMRGFGVRQSIALFGQPASGQFEFVLTGRHGTYRCDGDSTDQVAFGGPIMYGHAAGARFEKPHHPGNIFWNQALEANRLYRMLDGWQRRLALCRAAPDEATLAFRGLDTSFEGIPVTDMSPDQRAHLETVLARLLEPFRRGDQEEVWTLLRKRGGLEACHLAFYRADDLGEDGIWDNWRLEGPACVWHWRGAPHVHVWVHVAGETKAQPNAVNVSWPLRPDQLDE